MGLRDSLRRFFLAENGVSARPETGERGTTGQAYTFGSKGNAKRLVSPEKNWQLSGSLGYEIMDKMRRTDPKVRGLRRAMNLPLLGAQVRIDPVDPNDKRAVEIADFCRATFLDGMQTPWRRRLSEWLLFLDFGHAPFEIIWALRDGKVVIERIAYRPPSTISEIYVENGRIASVEQWASTGETLSPIPGEKLLWFVNDAEGDDFRGTGLLRSMYKPWYQKERYETLSLILAERMGGVPIVTEPPSGLTDEMRTKIDAALDSFAVCESGYLRLPDGAQFQLVSSQANVSQMKEMLLYWDQQLSTVAIQQFLDLGATPNGSRALGMTMSDMFINSLSAVAADIEDTINAADGVLAQLVAYNFAGADDLVPRLRFASLSKIDLKAMAGGLHQLWQMGMPFGEETWEWIRAELDLPAREAQDETTPQAPTASPGSSPNAQGSSSGPEASGTSAPQAGGQEPTQASELSLAEGSYWRPLRAVESFANLAEISAAMDAAPAGLRMKTQAARDAMVTELVRRVEAAVKTGDTQKVAALAQLKPPMVDKLAAALRSLYADALKAGQSQVRDELARQKAGTPIVDGITADRRGETIAAAEKRIKRALPPAIDDTAAYIDSLADVTARQIGAAASSAAAAVGMRSLVAPMAAEAIAEALTRASDDSALRAGVSITQVMIAGRSEEAAAERELIESAEYSAILDHNTCETCESMDGTTTEDLDEGLAWTPNPDCDGGDRCRCLTFFTYKDGAA